MDWRLAASFPASFEVHTVRQAGWGGTKNGTLLQRAADAGFDAVVTIDKNIEFQQNLNTLPIAIVVLETRSSDLKVLQSLIPRVVSMLEAGLGKTFMKAQKKKPNETFQPR